MKITLTDSSTSVTVQPRNFTVTLSGARGPAGQGLPAGGAEGQIIVKQSATDYDTAWADNYATNVELYVKNSTASPMTKGQVVYVSGADGNNPTITLAIATSEAGSSKTIGVLKQDLAVGALGYVVTDGLLEGLNTNAASVAGDTIWLSPTTAGGVVYGTANKPSAPNHLVFIGYVIRKNQNNGKIFVKIQNGFELQELHNVAISNPVTGQVLKYNATTQLWSNDTDTGGINTLNGLTASTQTFAAGTSGTDFAISSSTSTHTFNIPTASASARGLLSSTDWSTFNGKQGALSFDSTPTNGSTNPVTSDGVFDALALKQNVLTNPVTGTGTSGQVSYWTGTGTQTGSNNLFWDAVNSRLGVNASTLVLPFEVDPPLVAAPISTLPVGNIGFANFSSGANSPGIVSKTNAGTVPALNITAAGIDARTSSADMALNVRSSSNTDYTTLTNVVAYQFSRFATPLFNIMRDAKVGINTTSPSGQLHIVGSGTTSATTALLVQNSTPTTLLQVLDNGRISQTLEGSASSTAFGSNALSVTTGSNNTAFGGGALEFTTSGNNNNAFGYRALRNNTTGVNNTAFGHIALNLITSSNNTAAGSQAGQNTTTGGNNSFFGHNAGNTNSTGGNNSFFGAFAGSNNTTANSNSIFGVFAGLNNTTGSSNIFIGQSAGRFITGGATALTIANNSIFLGFDTRANADNETNQIVIGYQTTGLGSNTTTIGNASTTQTNLYGNLTLGTTTSGGRLTVRGSGTTSAANSLLVEDSAGTDTFVVRNDGGYAFKGGTVGVAQTGYTTFTNLTTDRTCDANATTVEELADILGTLIEDLKTKGIISA